MLSVTGVVEGAGVVVEDARSKVVGVGDVFTKEDELDSVEDGTEDELDAVEVDTEGEFDSVEDDTEDELDSVEDDTEDETNELSVVNGLLCDEDVLLVSFELLFSED